MCVCKHTVVRFLFFWLPDRCKLKQRKARVGHPGLSRGVVKQTYWEACQKCSASVGGGMAARWLVPHSRTSSARTSVGAVRSFCAECNANVRYIPRNEPVLFQLDFTSIQGVGVLVKQVLFN